MARQWTLALEDEIRRTVFKGQVCLEDLLPEEELGALASVQDVPGRLRPDGAVAELPTH